MDLFFNNAANNLSLTQAAKLNQATHMPTRHPRADSLDSLGQGHLL
jgi:hypothetical protein